MPASPEMSWELKSRRWWKQHKGLNDDKPKRYVISCRQLAKWSGKDFPWTKEGSYQIANAWWRQKKAEIDGQKPPHPLADQIAEMERRRDWSRTQGDADTAEYYAGQAKVLQANPDAASVLDLNRQLRLIQTKMEFGVDLSDIPQEWLGWLADDQVWADRIANDRAEPIPEDRTVDFQVRRYLANEAIREKAGQIKAGELDTARRCVEYFQGWVRDKFGPDSPAESLNAEALDDYYYHLLMCGISDGYKMKRLRFARSFIESVAMKGLIPSPPNLRSRRHRFNGSAQAIETMTVKEAKALISHAQGPLRLYLLLMVNTGVTQVDISDLRQDEVDWTEGRIIRRRSKVEKAPVINYKLWPLTFQLLCEYREPKGEYVLLTDTKERLVRSYTKPNGKRYKYDAIRKPFERLAKSLKIEKTPRIFRKTSASLLKTHEVFQNFDQVFLDHAPTTTAARHYSATANDLFDRAIAWLGEQYGFLPRIDTIDPSV